MTLVLSTLSADGRPVADLSAFSPPLLRLVALVPGGTSWLTWALRADTPTFHFRDERALLSGLAQGLHGSAVQSFSSPELEIDLSVLLALEEPAINDVVSSLETGQLTPAAQAALAQAGIFIAPDFATAQEQLRAAGRPALYASASLGARCEWLTTLQQAEIASPESARAAAGFAATVSGSLSAFAAAWAYHLAIGPTLPEPSAATLFWRSLAPHAFSQLSCPVIEPDTPDDALLEFLTVSVTKTDAVGFATLSHAIAAFARSAGLPRTLPLDETTTAETIRAFLAKLPDVVRGSASVRRLQDGATRWITFDGPAGRARFQHGGDGHLTLLELVPA